MRAILLASATAASTLRSISSPARVILPSRVLPAVEWSFGVSPIQAAKCRPEANAPGSVVFITSVVAPIGPIAGIFARRRLSALARCQAINHRRRWLRRLVEQRLEIDRSRGMGPSVRRDDGETYPPAHTSST